jgi:geranylgeranyl pyrophosphate synthase
MTAVKETAADPVSPLVTTLQLELIGGSSDVPAQLWDAALLGPLSDFLSRPGKEVRGRMVELGYALSGGDPERMPETLPLLIELLHAGSLIVDDIEDGSALRRGKPALHCTYGLPVALNAGNWLYFWPQVLLSRMALPSAARLEAHERIAECLLRCHEGQALDLTARVDTLCRADVPKVVRAITTLKTGQLIGLACALGAIAAGATTRRIEALAAFGRDIGIGLQMLDDLSGALNPNRRDKALEDLRGARSTWIWAWLADDLDATRYHEQIELLRGARAVPDSNTGDPSKLDALLANARFRLAMTGIRRVRRSLDETIATLAQAVGGGEWEHVVRAELGALERAFMEGA